MLSLLTVKWGEGIEMEDRGPDLFARFCVALAVHLTSYLVFHLSDDPHARDEDGSGGEHKSGLAEAICPERGRNDGLLALRTQGSPGNVIHGTSAMAAATVNKTDDSITEQSPTTTQDEEGHKAVEEESVEEPISDSSMVIEDKAVQEEAVLEVSNRGSSVIIESEDKAVKEEAVQELTRDSSIASKSEEAVEEPNSDGSMVIKSEDKAVEEEDAQEPSIDGSMVIKSEDETVEEEDVPEPNSECSMIIKSGEKAFEEEDVQEPSSDGSMVIESEEKAFEEEDVKEPSSNGSMVVKSEVETVKGEDVQEPSTDGSMVIKSENETFEEEDVPEPNSESSMVIKSGEKAFEEEAVQGPSSDCSMVIKTEEKAFEEEDVKEPNSDGSMGIKSEVETVQEEDAQEPSNDGYMVIKSEEKSFEEEDVQEPSTDGSMVIKSEVETVQEEDVQEPSSDCSMVIKSEEKAFEEEDVQEPSSDGFMVIKSEDETVEEADVQDPNSDGSMAIESEDKAVKEEDVQEPSSDGSMVIQSEDKAFEEADVQEPITDGSMVIKSEVETEQEEDVQEPNSDSSMVIKSEEKAFEEEDVQETSSDGSMMFKSEDETVEEEYGQEPNSDSSISVIMPEGHNAEIERLRNLVQSISDRNASLENEMLEYYGLKEQESTVRELEHRLKLTSAEAKCLSLKIESLKDENRRLKLQVSESSALMRELESARLKIEDDQSVHEQAREKIASLEKSISMLLGKERKNAMDEAEAQRKLNRLKELEEEAAQLRREKLVLAEENFALAQRLKFSAPKDPDQVAALLEEVGQLREGNEELKKKIEQLKTDRCADVEELVYLRWLNACMRYEQRDRQPPPGTVIAKDLSKWSSPKSEEKVKKLVLHYAYPGLDDDHDEKEEYSYSDQESHEEHEPFDVDSFLANHISPSKTKLLGKLKKLIPKKSSKSNSEVASVYTSPAGRASISTCSIDEETRRRSFDSAESCFHEEDSWSKSEPRSNRTKKKRAPWFRGACRSPPRIVAGERRVRMEKEAIVGRCNSDLGASYNCRRRVRGEDNTINKIGSIHQERGKAEHARINKYAEALLSSRAKPELV